MDLSGLRHRLSLSLRGGAVSKVKTAARVSLPGPSRRCNANWTSLRCLRRRGAAPESRRVLRSCRALSGLITAHEAGAVFELSSGDALDRSEILARHN